MKATTEDNQETSQHLYEDEHVFLNKKEVLYLKETQHSDRRKLCTVSKDDVEEKLQTLQEDFVDLQKRVEQITARDEPEIAKLSELENEVKHAEAVGDFNHLLTLIEDKKMDTTQESTKPEKTAASEQETDSAPIEEETKQKEVADAVPPTNNSKVVSEESDAEEVEANKAEEKYEEPINFYKDIVKKAAELATHHNWTLAAKKLDDLSHRWSEGPDADQEQIKKLFQKFNKSVEKLNKRKKEHKQQQKERKQKNLEAKQKLLKEFEGIVSNKTWTAARRVGQLKSQWNKTGRLPAGNKEKLDKRFEELISIFDEHKVDQLVQKRQKEEDNLMLKLTVLEKMEHLTNTLTHETTNWKEIDKQFDNLNKQWKKTGRVPKEKSDQAWGRYKAAQDKYYDQKYRYDTEHQSKVDKFRHKKAKICEKAEELLEEKDIASAARQINKLHRRWKKAGNLPQRAENELWSRFKEATDEFNERKSNNQDKIKEQEDKHYQQKLELIDKATALKDTDDFKKGHRKMQDFMNRWKQIGPVPRKKSNKIWKQFKGAMDEFYDRRREHFKEMKEQQKDNLEEKQEILDKLHELGSHKDPIEAVNIAKELQERFKNVGYVPIKHKNKMWDKYRGACDVIYDRFRAAKSGDKFDQELAKADLSTNKRNKIQQLRKEFKKVKKEARDLEKEVIQWQEKKSYFKPSNGSNSLLDDVKNKIEKFQNQLKEKNNRMDELTEQMDNIRVESE